MDVYRGSEDVNGVPLARKISSNGAMKPSVAEVPNIM